MSYIDRNLSDGEVICFRTKKHYIIYLTALAFFVIAIFFSIPNPITNVVDLAFRGTAFAGNLNHFAALIFFILGVFWSFKQWLLYKMSDFVVTNKRVIMREGLVGRYMCDTRLASISQVVVVQPLFGQILNYGTIIIKGFGGTEDLFIQVAKPYDFQKNVHEQLDKAGR